MNIDEDTAICLPDDNSLIEVIRNLSTSDKKKSFARERLYIKYSGVLVKYAQYLGASPGDAEDIAQEALLRALITKLEQFEPQSDDSFRAWVRTIVRNLYFNERKKKGRNLPLVEELEGHEPDPFDQINYNREIYREAGLSDLETEVVILHIDHGLKAGEIAYVMPEHTPENISRIIYRSKEKLRKRFNE